MAQPNKDQLASLCDLFEMAQRDHGGARVARRFLLSLYNGSRFPFDLTDFRLLDTARFEQCMAVLAMDHTPAAEVHVILGRYFREDGRPMGYLFERWAYDMKLPGRCKKDQLDYVERTARGAAA
jgi:hypothetical protein